MIMTLIHGPRLKYDTVTTTEHDKNTGILLDDIMDK
jgi:hypothetical protein